MNLEWRKLSKKQFVLVDTRFATSKDYLEIGVMGRVIERKQDDGRVLWEGWVYAPNPGRAFLSGRWKSQMFGKKAEAMTMVSISLRMENYDGFE